MTVDILGDPLLCCPPIREKCCLFLCDVRGLLVQHFTVLPPSYTAPRSNATCFGAMDVGVLGDAFLCYSPPPSLNAAWLIAMGADVPLLCCIPCTAVRVSAAHF